MSEIERLKRMQGMRAAQPLSMLPALPVIDHCLLRQDSITIGKGQQNTAIGSALVSVAVIPAAPIAASSLLVQWPGVSDGTIVAAGIGGLDSTRFFKPGWWHIQLNVFFTSVLFTEAPRLIFIPWDIPSKVLRVGPFQGAKGGGFTVPMISFFGATPERNWFIDFETFFPEPWVAYMDAGPGMAVTSKLAVGGSFTQTCALDDISAAVDPSIAP